MKPKTTILLLMSLFSLSAPAQSPWTNYTNDRLISDVLVTGNNVWVGSQGGLTRTNLLTGEFQTYLACNSPIKGGGILEIEKAPDNALWFVSENAGLFRLKNEEWTNYTDEIVSSQYYRKNNLQILPNGDVWFFADHDNEPLLNKLVRIRNGVVESYGNLPLKISAWALIDEHTIYFAKADTVHRYDASLQQVVQSYHSGNSILTSDDVFRQIITDRNGALILPADDRILQLKNGVISVLSTPGLSVNKAFKDGVGNVYLQPYLNEPNNIRLVKYDGIKATYLKDIDFAPYPISDRPLFRGADSQGGLYADLFNVDSEFILYRFFEGSWTPVKSQIYPLLDNYQDDVQSDCNGNLWFGSRNGVDVKYTDGTWEHFPIEVGQYQYFLVWQMTVDPITCDVWFANNSNSSGPNVPGIIRISNGTVTPFLLGQANISDIEATVDGKVYFCSAIGGIGYIENDAIHYIQQLKDTTFVFSMDSDSKGNLYIAPWGPSLIKYDGAQVTQYGDGEVGDLVYNAIVDNDDLVWVVGHLGVKVFDGAHWTDYSSVWPSSTLNGLVQDRKGNYWVSTWSDGLYYWDKQTLQHFDIFNSGLSTNSLRSVALDPDGDLIVTQRVGASVLDIPDITDAYKGSGTVFFDYAKDSIFDQGIDFPVPGQKVRDADRNLWAVTNTYGQYTFYSDTSDTSHFQHALEAFAESTTDNPQSGALVDYHSTLPDFGFWKPYIPDVRVTIVNGVVVCNREFRVHIYLRNNSLFTTTGQFTLRYNDLLTLTGSSIPFSQQTNGEVVFQDLSIPPFAVLDITLTFTSPDFTAEGIALLFEGIFDTSDSPFFGTAMDTVVCSYDPNDKKVEPTGDFYKDYSLIKDPLQYTIRFQNEGSYKAFDITIIDTLDQQLDPSTFELLASSHVVETTVTTDGIVTFIFRNIDLPARSVDTLGSQGFVTFTVQPDSSLSGPVSIDNKASIYFDFNPPIVTNTAMWHVTDDLAIVNTDEIHEDLSIYPNPTTGTLFLTMDKAGEYQVWDATGRPIDAGLMQVGSNTIQLNITSGIYYLQVTAGEERYVIMKVVVMR